MSDSKFFLLNSISFLMFADKEGDAIELFDVTKDSCIEEFLHLRPAFALSNDVDGNPSSWPGSLC